MTTDKDFALEKISALGGPNKLHGLIDIVPDAMVVIDVQGRILSFNKGTELIFGYLEREVLGENVSLLMSSPDRVNHDRYMERYIQTGEKRIIGIGRITTARRRDGTIFPIELAIGEVSLPGDNIYAGFIRDLTEYNETERQLHGLQGELAHVSRISSMGTLATSIAHELNQPLTALTNYAQTARDLLEEPDAENIRIVRNALDECAKEALRAGQIVHRLRDFISRGDSERQIVSLQRLVNEATALSLINGNGKDVDFRSNLDPKQALVLVDPIQIQQVLVNLICNALEAMEGMKPRILVISSKPVEKRMIQVTVSDSGPGIEPKIADRLFHPFVSTKRSGMGLGLSICHTIVSSHGGTIRVEQSEYGGTAFSFTLMDGSEVQDDE